MKMSGHTILITGGSSGIGLELARQLKARGNTIIVTGRDQAKLAEAAKAVPGIRTVQSDTRDPKAIVELAASVTKEFPALNVVINNAGVMRKVSLHDAALPDITREIEINLMGPVRMVQAFLPHLKTKASAAIVNVSSGLAFVPLPLSPIYCATKAGLHSYTQSLRVQLKRTKVQVFELAPPGTDTPLFAGDFTPEETKEVRPMPVDAMVRACIEGMEKGTLEVCPGMASALRRMSRLVPGFALKMLAKSADKLAVP